VEKQPTVMVKSVSIKTGARNVLRTKATPAEAVEQAKAPVTLPIRTDWAILGVLVATHLHRRSVLKKKSIKKT
jgi:hypothetical protein